jgi:hypothetical protein
MFWRSRMSSIRRIDEKRVARHRTGIAVDVSDSGAANKAKRAIGNSFASAA